MVPRSGCAVEESRFVMKRGSRFACWGAYRYDSDKRAEERLRALYEAASDLYFAGRSGIGHHFGVQSSVFGSDRPYNACGNNVGGSLRRAVPSEAASWCCVPCARIRRFASVESSLRKKNQMPLRILLTANSGADAQTRAADFPGVGAVRSTT